MQNDRGLVLRHMLYLFLTALIWGTAFVAQSVGNIMGPFTFTCLRTILGGLVLIPFIKFYYKSIKPDRTTVIGGICCGICLFLASNLQQYGLLFISPGKAGFITAGYILIVPILGLFAGKKLNSRIVVAVLAAIVGLYLLCIPEGENMSLNIGDLLCLSCAFFFSVQIIIIDRFSAEVEGVKMACIQFFVCGLLSALLVLLFEDPKPESIAEGFFPMAYAGVFSIGIAYTLQIVGQAGVNPTVASLIMSLESCIAVIAGWLILGQGMNSREIAGCIIMFAAIILTQLPGRKKQE